MVRSAWAAAVVLLCAACGGGGEPAFEPARIVSGYGLGIGIPPGWDGRVHRASPDAAIVLQAASFRLGPPGELVTGADLGSNDVYVEIDDLGAPPARLDEDTAWDIDARLPPVVGPDDVEGPYEGGFPAGATLGLVVADRALMIRVRFGSAPDAAALAEVNAVLATLVAER